MGMGKDDAVRDPRISYIFPRRPKAEFGTT